MSTDLTPHYVVAHPGKLPLAVGDLFPSAKTANTLRARGAVVLPTQLEFLQDFHLGGFVRRDWGDGSFMPNLFDQSRGQGGAPTTIQVPGGISHLHWAAEIFNLSSTPDGVAAGTFRLWCDASSGLLINSGLQNLTQPVSYSLERSGDSLIIEGKALINSAHDGLVALGLWGVCTKTHVKWLAVTNTRDAA